MSIISGLIITWLFFSELSFYLSTDVQPELFVDTSRGEKLRINMDVTFPDLPCGCASRPLSSLHKPLWPQHILMLPAATDLSVDAMDVSGEHQLDVEHNIFKKRLAADGRPLGIEKGGTHQLPRLKGLLLSTPAPHSLHFPSRTRGCRYAFAGPGAGAHRVRFVLRL